MYYEDMLDGCITSIPGCNMYYKDISDGCQIGHCSCLGLVFLPLLLCGVFPLAVSSQSGSLGEPHPAHLALVRPLPGVHSLVLEQLPRLSEPLLTDGALEGLAGVGVDVPVAGEVRRALEGLATVGAHIGLHLQVTDAVPLQVGAVGEGPGTHRAHVGFDVGRLRAAGGLRQLRVALELPAFGSQYRPHAQGVGDPHGVNQQDPPRAVQVLGVGSFRGCRQQALWAVRFVGLLVFGSSLRFLFCISYCILTPGSRIKV